MKDNQSLIDSIIDLFRVPLTYLNLFVVGLSMSDIESGVKIFVYLIGIVASIYSIRKSRMEIKKLTKEEQQDNLGI